MVPPLSLPYHCQSDNVFFIQRKRIYQKRIVRKVFAPISFSFLDFLALLVFPSRTIPYANPAAKPHQRPHSEELVKPRFRRVVPFSLVRFSISFLLFFSFLVSSACVSTAFEFVVGAPISLVPLWSVFFSFSLCPYFFFFFWFASPGL